ncbi:MAG TPA: SDR family oxidoreductase [Terriglobia bacterium]|nr:SDR family oxidoreductase [Terriglobia bacterium]
MEHRPLQGQVALVTGAGKRIGRAIALELGRAGANVVVNYNQSKVEAETAVREIRALGVRSVAIRADVARPQQVEAMFRAVDQRFGRLDLLVNNAGLFFHVPWDKLSERDWDRILSVNLKGPFYCAQAAARLMLRGGGSRGGAGKSGRRARASNTDNARPLGGQIINISSLGGLQAWPGYMHYCASKAGLIMLTRCLAKALAPHIRVNSVAPGTILFPGDERDPQMRKLLRSTPLQKGGRAEDIASAVLWLATSAEFMTGQVLAVDGGKSIP